MAPANWDAPFIISPFDNRTLYAGTNRLWKSTDQGDTWIDLGDLTTGINRRELTIMGQRAHDSTPSLDDGIPYYPTITQIAESPRRKGVLYVGTDDGNFQVSMDGGKTWTNVSSRMPGLPPRTWISGIEASRHADGTVYVAVNNYRNDDFENYLYRSTDFGQTWVSIVGDLPPRRVARTIKEDLRNPEVLYLGTELGFFYSNDGGRHWVELKANLPTVAVNDFVIHPRDNDLVLGTHGRGIWILDNINSLQELTPEVLNSEAHLFTLEPAEQIRYTDETAHTGDLVFRGENPPAGAIIDYYLRSPAPTSGPGAIRLEVLDPSGAEIRRLEPKTGAGINRVIWDLRYPDVVSPPRPQERPGSGGAGRVRGPWVMPGEYVVRLSVNGRSYERRLQVLNDPRIEVDRATLQGWHDTLRLLAQTIREFAPVADSVAGVRARLDSLTGEQQRINRNLAGEIREVHRLAQELRDRLIRLYDQIQDWPGNLTADQRTQVAYYREFMTRLQPRIRRVLRSRLP
jgi:hypothetical protein